MTETQTRPVAQTAHDHHPVGERLSPSSDLLEYARQYARERPEIFALACLGIGFALGWKLKIW
jgi:hypothetical protein